MKIIIILLLSLLIKLYLADEEDYSFLKKFENGRLVSLDEGECPNLKNDPLVRDMIAKRNRRKAMASSSAPALAPDESTTTKTAAVTTAETSDSISAAVTSKVSTGASSQTTIASSTAETPTKGSCNITFNAICYRTYVALEGNVNFTRAEEICSDKASTPAHFPNEKVYSNVVEELRSKIPSGWSWVYIWTGVTIDTNTGNVIHPSGGTYVKWNPNSPGTGFPWIGSNVDDYTHVALYVNPNPDETDQGMFNYFPQSGFQGVFCQSVE